eukprot:m.229205 g.229205  ORF g.229205 m.229205 type:complete len:279 (-) comp17693_c0_seq1:39-875(-)
MAAAGTTLQTDLNTAIFTELLASQMANLPPADFLDRNSPEIKPTMHHRLADWLLEECEAYNCVREVFPTAVVLMDRFVGAATVSRQTYQLLGATALHLASKLLGPVVIPAHNLCEDMDGAFSLEQMKAQELMLLTTLGWHVECAKPFEFLEHFLPRMSFTPTPLLAATLRTHAEVFVCLCYTDIAHARFGPAIIAAASLYLAVFGIDGPQGTIAACDPGHTHRDRFLDLLQYFPGRETVLPECVRFIELLYSTSLPASSPPPTPNPAPALSPSGLTPA